MEDRLRNELLMAVQTRETQPVQPFSDRLALAVAKREWCVTPQRCASRRRVVVMHGCHTKNHGRPGDGPAVLLSDAGVADPLSLAEAAVAEDVSEQHHLVTLPVLELVRRRHVPRHSHP